MFRKDSATESGWKADPRGQKNTDAEYFEPSSDEEVASAREMRPAPLGEPQPQERVQRHTVEQMTESSVPVPMLDLDSPVPQLVDQLVVVLQGLDMFTPVGQGIEVPKITLEDGIQQRAVLREPLPVEQLADVPVPETVTLARGRCALGVVWYHVAARRKRSCWWMGGTSHVQWRPPGGFAASPWRYTILGAVVRRRAVPQIQEQILEVPAVRVVLERECASDSVHRQTFVVFSCATETGTHSANCAGIRDSSAVLG